MGNSPNSPKDKKSICQANKTEYARKLFFAQKGALVHSCSYNKWISKSRHFCGFSDLTDYTTTRESYKRRGVLVKPDGTNGRHFILNFKNPSCIVVSEKESWRYISVSIPRIDVRSVPHSSWFYNRDRSETLHRKDASVIALRDNIAIIQVCFERNFQTSLFFIINLDTQKYLGHFSMTHTSNLRLWYECYISPNKSRILLRPGRLIRSRIAHHGSEIEDLELEARVNIKVSTIETRFSYYVATFNPHIGESKLVLARDSAIYFMCLESEDIVGDPIQLNLPTSIQQIRSSPSGDFLAVRCVDPVQNKEYSVNTISVISFFSMTVLFTVDVKGGYWPISETINLQVFPRFSPSEACLAVMRNRTAKRKVYVYKLPVAQTNLQHLCRRVILHIVRFKEIPMLPIPVQLKKYLTWDDSS